jgi:hypothetical protein
VTDPKPVTDLSPKVISLARMIDRLPPGDYAIRVIKGQDKAAPWHTEISGAGTVRVVDIDKPG